MQGRANSIARTAPYRVALWLADGLALMGAAILLATILLTFADVAGRYLFAAPVPGAFQLTRAALALFIFAGLPAVSLRGEQLTVGLFDGHFPVWLEAVLNRLMPVVSAAALGAFAWALWQQGEYLRDSREVLDRLHIPLAAFAFYMGFMAAIATLVAMVALVTPKRSA